MKSVSHGFNLALAAAMKVIGFGKDAEFEAFPNNHGAICGRAPRVSLRTDNDLPFEAAACVAIKHGPDYPKIVRVVLAERMFRFHVRTGEVREQLDVKFLKCYLDDDETVSWWELVSIDRRLRRM